MSKTAILHIDSKGRLSGDGSALFLIYMKRNELTSKMKGIPLCG